MNSMLKHFACFAVASCTFGLGFIVTGGVFFALDWRGPGLHQSVIFLVGLLLAVLSYRYMLRLFKIKKSCESFLEPWFLE